MAQYIDREAVVAEIEKIKSILGNPFCLSDTAKASWVARKGICDDILSFLDTLEVKEVDLKKYYHEFLQKEWFGNSHVRTISEIMAFTAKHFFELGLRAQKEHLWKSADGDDLPEIGREVIVLLNNGRVTFGHRPSEYFDSKDIITEKVTRNYIERYDKGLWNLPNIKYWLDYDLPKIKEE